MKNSPATFLELLWRLPLILREPPGNQKPVLLPRTTGLGDTVHNLLERWGIGPKVRAYFNRHKRNCGCEHRRQRLNALWPYKPERGKPFLTIGMPHFQDWEGAWATIQNILYEATAAGIRDRIEIVVVDQSPDSEHGKKLAGYLRGWVPRSKYVAQENLGTAQGKNAVFHNASGEWVLLLDCHASLMPGSLKRIFDFAAKHRHSEDLYAGVMDLGAGYHDHRETIVALAEWMTRTTPPRTAPLPAEFLHLTEPTISYVAAKVKSWADSELGSRNSDLRVHVLGTDWGYHSHVDRVWRGDSLGRWATDPRAADPNAPPFEIDNAAGWFLFCRRDAWLRANPYHPLMRGFGGEEGVMTLAFARRGRKTYLAPFARGTHRFGRADGVKFSLQLKDRLRNYALAFHSLGAKDELARMRQYFTVDRGKASVENTAKDFERFSPMPEPEFDAIVAQAIADHEAWLRDLQTKRRPPPKPLEQLYTEAKSTPSDFNEHVETLRKLASECQHVTEFGTRHGVSTVALVAAQPKVVVTVDQQCAGCHIGFLKAVEGNTDLRLVQADSRTIEIEPTDMLVIDTYHVADQLRDELKQADKVRRYIVLHDTVTFGEIGEHGQPGLLVALREWLPQHPEWEVVAEYKNNHGLTVLQRRGTPAVVTPPREDTPPKAETIRTEQPA